MRPRRRVQAFGAARCAVRRGDAIGWRAGALTAQNVLFWLRRLRGTMSQFRSEEMNLVQLFVQSDAAHDTLHELGQIGAIQFKDVRALAPPALFIRSCACVRPALMRLCAGGSTSSD